MKIIRATASRNALADNFLQSIDSLPGEEGNRERERERQACTRDKEHLPICGEGWGGGWVRFSPTWSREISLSKFSFKRRKEGKSSDVQTPTQVQYVSQIADRTSILRDARRCVENVRISLKRAWRVVESVGDRKLGLFL
jgi:hypothetical protein